jgi:hypothetical protein
MRQFGERFDRAVARFLEQNSRDPNVVMVDGVPQPKELVAAKRLAQWIEKLDPAGSEALHLAAYCQHLRRWEIARGDFDAGRIGYLKWRKTLGRFHADEAARVLREVGYDESTVEAVKQINMKLALQTNPDCATMEDALCLSFLEHEFAEFSAKHPDEKVVDIVAKTWKKMTAKAHAVALTLPFDERSSTLIKQALATPSA